MSEPRPDLPRTDAGSGTFEVAPPPPAHGVVKSGVVWISAGFGLTQILRLGSSIVLAYLLDPHSIGLLAITFVFLTGLQLFSDLGICVSIIQNPRGEEQAFLDTAWTIQVIRGFGLWLGACALAWPVAYLRPKPEPDLLWLLPMVGFFAVIEGFTSTKLSSLQRHLRQKEVTLISLIATAGGTAAMLIWAAIDRSVIAMAVGPLVNSFILVVLSHLLPGPGNRFRWDPSCVRSLIHFGRWIFLSTVCSFLADHTDRIVVSYFSIAILGVYHLANQLAGVPGTLMGTYARQIVLPFYSRLIDARQDLAKAVHTIQMRTGAATALLIAGLIAVGPTMIHFLYDGRYEAASWILPILAVVMMIQIFDNNASSLLLARGKAKTYALSNAIKVMCLIAFMPIGAWLGDRVFDSDGALRGLMFAMILGELGRYLCTGIALQLDGLPIFRRDVCWGVFAIAVGMGVNYAINLQASPMPEAHRFAWVLLGRMVVEGCSVIVVWCLVVLIGLRLGWMRARPEVA